MRHTIWTGTCAAIVSVAAAGLLAQTPAQTPAAQSPASNTNKKITVTGCLKAAPQMPGDVASAATTGTTGTTAVGTTGAATAGTTGTTAESKFILTGASAQAADAASSAQTYRLIANPKALTEHVGKKLEVTGTIDPTSTADPKDPSASAPALRVESGKIVAATCSE
ncbi:MAG: hypothetical protein ACRD2I_16360 [Vicinamibacterales bacterium]